MKQGEERGGGEKKIVPFTARMAEWLVAPALLDAEHVYSPACLAATDSMLRMLFFFVVATTLISERSRPIGSPFNAHEISIGKSPLRMAHTTEIESPQLAGSSVITNGAICGATVTQHFLFPDFLFPPSFSLPISIYLSIYLPIHVQGERERDLVRLRGEAKEAREAARREEGIEKEGRNIFICIYIHESVFFGDVCPS